MPSGYVMHRTPTLRTAPTRPRPRPMLRLRARWNAPELDSALADGVDPAGSEELRARAAQLARPKQRAELATAIEHLVAIADRPSERLVSAPPLFRRDQVRANRSLLLSLAERLSGEGPHALKGVAMTSVLLNDFRSPIHVKGGARTLEEAVRATLSALDS
jgi:hypothetical protein